jgi:phosphohistidine phosphatase SixA
MRTLEVRRHAIRDPQADRLSPEGRAQAEELGRELAAAIPDGYDVIFVSPATRAAETVAHLLRGLRRPLPRHAVIPGLAGEGTDRSPLAMAGVLSALLDAVPEGGRGLAVGHTPLIERGVLGLVGAEIEPLAECEGVLLVREDDGPVRVEELRR